MRFLFSTESMEPEGRFEGFRDALARRMFNIDIEAVGSGPFFGKVELEVGGPAIFGRVLGSTSRLSRISSVARECEEGAWLLMTRTGRMHFAQHGIERDLGPGEAMIFNTVEPLTGRCVEESDTWIVEVPETVLTALGARNPGDRTRVLERDNAIAQLLSSVLESAHSAEALSPDVSQVTGLYLADLVALALGTDRDGGEIAAQRGLKAARLRAVLDDIREHFPEAQFDAADVAARLGVTPRYIHLLLEETGRTFSEHVLEHRLEFAWRLLRDPSRRTRRVADIAYACGFTDLSYFNRTYRRRFDKTPSDTRDG